MTYEEALKYIHNRRRTAGSPTLDRMKLLCRYLGDPQEKLKFVHIAGTNGKGSTATMLASVLECAGYRVGRYVSPYIIDFCERICVDGDMIERDELAKLTRTVLSTVRRINYDIKKVLSGEKNATKIPKKFLSDNVKFAPVEFEVVTAIAFLYFLERGCDIVVLECGLGGEFDATNIIPPPKLAIITSIGFDHTELLGETINKITKTKCGIIKKGTNAVVSYPQPYKEASRVIKNICEKRLATYIVPLDYTIEVTRATLGELEFKYRRTEYTASLPASYQATNACVVIEAAEALSREGVDVPEYAIRQGIAKAKFPARFEVLSVTPDVILDGAHNEDGVRVLAESIANVLHGGKLNLVIGMLKDKNPEKTISVFKETLEKTSKIPVNYGTVTALTPNNPRALDANDLAGILEKVFGGSCEALTAYRMCDRGLAKAIKSTGDNDTLLCFGSLYMAAEIRERFPGVMLTL